MRHRGPHDDGNAIVGVFVWCVFLVCLIAAVVVLVVIT